MTWRDDYAVEAAQEGRHAARSGDDENPHPWGSSEWRAWNEGHDSARDRDETDAA